MKHVWNRVRRLKDWPLAVFIIVAVVMGNVLLVTYFISYSQIRESDRWVDSTQANIALVLEVSTALQEAIVAQHSYLSLGRSEYRDLARTKLDALPAAVKTLAKQVRTYDSQNELAEIQYEVNALLKLGHEFMDSRARGDLAGAYDPKRSEGFFTLARHIQQNLDLVRNREDQLLDERLERAKSSQSYYVSAMLIASLTSLAIVVVLSWLMLRLRSRQELVEDELKEARDRISLAIQGTSDGVYDWHPTTNVLYLSPRFKEIYGFQPHEMPNARESVHARIHPEDLEHVTTTTQNYLDHKMERYECVFRAIHKDGTLRWILSRGAAQWDKHGKPTRMVGVHTDITSLKQMEDELREAKMRADSASRAKTYFLANMSHEIRTPMNAIIGISGILARKTPHGSREREYVEALDIASKSLFALINDLLDISKLDDGSLQLEHAPFEIRRVLEDSLAMARIRANEKGVALESRIAPNLPEQLIGDAHRLGQIVNNLLSNAVKFTEHGNVTLTAGRTPVGHFELRVKDTGIGIPREAQATIFEKFTQSDPSITRRFGGTGLGLSICRELSELMGGEIELISSEGNGAEFIVTLPLPAVAAAPAEDTAPADPVSDGEAFVHGTVLLVEDYRPNILVARTVLAGYGYGCEAVSTGHEALALLTSPAHAGFVAVLMDVQLPDIDGVEITRRVRAHERDHGHRPVPIIAMTAHALMGDREKFIAAGMDAYIPKPFDPEELNEKLTTLALPAPAPKKAPARKPGKKAS